MTTCGLAPSSIAESRERLLDAEEAARRDVERALRDGPIRRFERAAELIHQREDARELLEAVGSCIGGRPTIRSRAAARRRGGIGSRAHADRPGAGLPVPHRPRPRRLRVPLAAMPSARRSGSLARRRSRTLRSMPIRSTCRLRFATMKSGGITITVTDDGRGGARMGPGLRGIAERVEALGGITRAGQPGRRRHDRAGSAAPQPDARAGLMARDAGCPEASRRRAVRFVGTGRRGADGDLVSVGDGRGSSAKALRSPSRHGHLRRRWSSVRPPRSSWSALVAVARGSPAASAGIGLGFAWLVREWANPATAHAWMLTAGLLFGAALAADRGAPRAGTPALILRFRDASRAMIALRGRWLRLGPAVVRTATFDPAAGGCRSCAPNLLLIVDAPQVAAVADRVGVILQLTACVLLVGWLATGMISASTAVRSVRAPVAVAERGALRRRRARVLECVDRRVRCPRGDAPDDRCPVALCPGHRRRDRVGSPSTASDAPQHRPPCHRVCRRHPRPGSLRDELARLVGDPTITLGFPLDDGRVVDESGREMTEPLT